MHRSHRLPTLVLLGALSLSSGCIAAAAGAFTTVGFVGYESNVLVREFDTGLERTRQAGVEALVDLGFPEPECEELDPTRFRLKTDGVKLVVERHAGSITRIEVRAGTFDTRNNRRRALLVAEEIAFLLEN